MTCIRTSYAMRQAMFRHDLDLSEAKFIFVQLLNPQIALR